jgi:hypothetical protein
LPTVTASLSDLDFRPENKGSRHDALLVCNAEYPFSKLMDATNYKQLLSSVGASPNFAFLNARVADPIFDVYGVHFHLLSIWTFDLIDRSIAVVHSSSFL